MAGQDPRIGEHEVDSAQFGDAVGHRGLEPFEVADVALFGDDAAARFLDEVDRLVEVLRAGHRIRHGGHLLAQVERDDVRALFGKPDRVRTTLPPCRAGDERDLPLELHSP